MLIISSIMSGCAEEEKLNYSLVGGWKTGTVEINFTREIFLQLELGIDENILPLNLTDKDNNEWSFRFKIYFEDKGILYIAEELNSGNVETWERV